MLQGKHIVLGVTGGIAAYKSALLVREFVKAGAEVQVVMTEAAAQFITPLTLGTLSRREVILAMFPGGSDRASAQWTRHIELGMWADVMVVAPATANTLAKIAYGFADNFLTTLVLALRCPLVLAPAMDLDMWHNDATQRNIVLLQQRGVHIIDPEEGELASGLEGAGRLPDPVALLRAVEQILASSREDLRGKKVLVTAGPTQEPIDPVRYIGNRSSGKMGFAIAAAAQGRGADVTLITGPVSLGTPRGVRRIDVSTAAEMSAAAHREFPAADLVVMAAAVADFSPVVPSFSKIKREAAPSGSITLQLKHNPDILKSLGERKAQQILVGFALETEDALRNAQNKLTTKRCDMIVLNNPTVEGSGFGAETNCVTIITADGRSEELPTMSKIAVAHAILDRVAPLLH